MPSFPEKDTQKSRCGECLGRKAENQLAKKRHLLFSITVLAVTGILHLKKCHRFLAPIAYFWNQRFSGKKGGNKSQPQTLGGLAAQFAETASNGSLEAVEVEVDPVVSKPVVEEV